MTANKSLINFYVPSDILKTFDRLCRVHGKPRSQILNELLVDHVLKVGKKAFSRIDQVRKIDEHLKSACENGDSGILDDLLPKAENDAESALKRKFPSFGKDAKPLEIL